MHLAARPFATGRAQTAADIDVKDGSEVGPEQSQYLLPTRLSLRFATGCSAVCYPSPVEVLEKKLARDGQSCCATF